MTLFNRPRDPGYTSDFNLKLLKILPEVLSDHTMNKKRVRFSCNFCSRGWYTEMFCIYPPPPREGKRTDISAIAGAMKMIFGMNTNQSATGCFRKKDFLITNNDFSFWTNVHTIHQLTGCSFWKLCSFEQLREVHIF